MTENQLEQETLACLADLSHTQLLHLISGQLRLPEVSHLIEEAC